MVHDSEAWRATGKNEKEFGNDGEKVRWLKEKQLGGQQIRQTCSWIDHFLKVLLNQQNKPTGQEDIRALPRDPEFAPS